MNPCLARCRSPAQELWSLALLEGGLTRAAADRGRGWARYRSHTTADGLEELPACRRHVLEVLRQSIEDGVVTTAHVLAGIMAHTPPNCCKRRACSRLRATQNLKKGFTCTPANP
jgi:hypothetical protein